MPDTNPHPALGLDLGAARIGVAITDDFGILARPLETISRNQLEPIARIRELTAIHRVRTLVIGLPLRMDGSEGTSARTARKFGQALAKAIPELPIHWIDETLTTVSAAEKLQEAGRRTKDHKAVIDQAAAVEILNLWITEAPGAERFPE